jgi:hypothetical protein
MNKWRQLICPAIRLRCAKKPDPGTQLGFKILLDRGLCHEVDITALYQQLQGRGLAKGRLRDGSQCFLSFLSPLGTSEENPIPVGRNMGRTVRAFGHRILGAGLNLLDPIVLPAVAL